MLSNASARVLRIPLSNALHPSSPIVTAPSRGHSGRSFLHSSRQTSRLSGGRCSQNCLIKSFSFGCRAERVLSCALSPVDARITSEKKGSTRRTTSPSHRFVCSYLRCRETVSRACRRQPLNRPREVRPTSLPIRVSVAPLLFPHATKASSRAARRSIGLLLTHRAFDRSWNDPLLGPDLADCVDRVGGRVRPTPTLHASAARPAAI
jgi:hypothetical protein